MSVTVRIPRVLSQAVTTGLRHEAEGETLGAVLESLFAREPGLENHLLDEDGEIRHHVLIFVDAARRSRCFRRSVEADPEADLAS